MATAGASAGGRVRGARGRRGTGDSEAHPEAEGQQAAADRRRDGDGRRRAEKGRSGARNRSRRGRRGSPREELNHGSPETTNRRRRRSSYVAAAMEVGAKWGKGLKGKELAGFKEEEGGEQPAGRLDARPCCPMGEQGGMMEAG